MEFLASEAMKHGMPTGIIPQSHPPPAPARSLKKYFSSGDRVRCDALPDAVGNAKRKDPRALDVGTEGRRQPGQMAPCVKAGATQRLGGPERRASGRRTERWVEAAGRTGELPSTRMARLEVRRETPAGLIPAAAPAPKRRIRMDTAIKLRALEERVSELEQWLGIATQLCAGYCDQPTTDPGGMCSLCREKERQEDARLRREARR